MGTTLTARQVRTGIVTGLAGAAALIALVNIASRVVGFLRWLVMANQVGPNAVGSAYAAANTLPNVVFEVVAGGALAGAVVPLVAAPLARRMRDDVDRTASALLGWALVVLVPLGVAVAIFSRPIVGLLMADAPEAQVTLAGQLLAMFAPQVPLYGIGLVLTGVLQAQRRFFAAAVAPLLNSLVVIATFFAFGRIAAGDNADPTAVSDAAVAVLGWGTTAGVAVMSLPLLVPVHRSGVRFSPTLRFPPGVAARARSLAAAGLGALVAQQASVVAAIVLSSRYGEPGTFAVFVFVQAVYFLPYAVLAFPLATAALPRLAEHAATDDRAAFARLSASTTRAVVVVSGLGAAALVAVAPAVEVAFVRVSDGDVTGLGAGVAWMAPGLLGYALILHLSRALYALDRGRAAVTATAAGWLTVVAAATAAVHGLTGGGEDQTGTLQGLGIGTTVGMTVAGVALVAAIARAAGRGALDGLARTVSATVVAGALGAVAGRAVLGLLPFEGFGPAILSGGAAGVVCAVVVLVGVAVVDRSVIRTIRR